MAETYCGKTCEGCFWKAKLHCAGCMDGPGRQYGGDCRIAGCCREKGHETCETCVNKTTCDLQRGRYGVPENRLNNKAVVQEQNNITLDRLQLLDRWLWPLFWLFIPNTLTGIFTTREIATAIPALYMICVMLRIICGISQGYFLIKLAGACSMYRTAGICTFITMAQSLIEIILFGVEEMPLWWKLISTIPLMIIPIYGIYKEFNAHSAVLTGVNDILSEKWDKLLKWFIICYAVLVSCTLIMYIIPAFSFIALVAIVVIFFISILRLVLLYNTASAFRDYLIAHKNKLLNKDY